MKFEYTEPRAHNIELIIRAVVPIGLSVIVARDGTTSSIRPLNPMANPITISFDMRIINRCSLVNNYRERQIKKIPRL